MRFRLNRFNVAGALAVPLLFVSLSFGQTTQPPLQKPKNIYGSGIGLNIALTNSGFGLGGYYMQSITETASLVADLMITTIKDEREQRFFNFFGESVIPNKENYLHILPFQIGLQKRLFKESIQDNFRPYLQIVGGPTLGWVSPYYDDLNGNGFRDSFEDTKDIISAFPDGETEIGVGGTISIGANFGVSKRVTQGIRFGYAFHYFPDGVQVLEPISKGKDSFFGTPTLTLTFGKIWR